MQSKRNGLLSNQLQVQPTPSLLCNHGLINMIVTPFHLTIWFYCGWLWKWLLAQQSVIFYNFPLYVLVAYNSLETVLADRAGSYDFSFQSGIPTPNCPPCQPVHCDTNDVKDSQASKCLIAFISELHMDSLIGVKGRVAIFFYFW